MNIEKLKNEAAMFLEEMHVSGDTMVDMNHCLDELPEEKQGAYYLHDLMALSLEQSTSPFSLKHFVNRRKAKRMREDAIITLELIKGITGERDSALKTMEEMANNVIELTNSY